MNRILVIGATGTVGREVVSQLAEAGASIRALVRNPDAARLPPMVELTRGDLTVPETLDAALDGIDAVFLVWVAPAATIGPVLERIARRARRIVFLSAPLKTAHPLFRQPNALRELHAEVERQIEASGVHWTFLRPGMFAANALRWWAPQIRVGALVRWPYLSAPTAPVDERDIAAVGVRALREDGHAGAEYVLTGPQSLTQFEQISTIGQAIGRPLRIEEMSPEQARCESLAGMPPFIAHMLLDAWAAALGQPALVTSTVAEITGKPARHFDEWTAHHAPKFRA
ncbi:MAG TPA: NAD(P)H-binding protein [Bryobacteraceae bacterium]|nr:NAD(P)H-binding protein [Bryobacteraceae bacterium]